MGIRGDSVLVASIARLFDAIHAGVGVLADAAHDAGADAEPRSSRFRLVAAALVFLL